MRTLLLLIFSLAVAFHSYGYDSRIMPPDTIPDTPNVKVSSGSVASGISLGTGVGSIFFGVISSALLINGGIDNWGGVFPIVWIIALVGIISGIVGLSKNHKMLQTNLTRQEMIRTRKVKRKSVTGIIFGIISIAITIFIIGLDSAFV